MSKVNDGGHEPRSYGDMVMGEYLKGLAEIAKEHPSKIEQLEALEKAATSPQWDRDVRSALGNLLAVAKAAKAYYNASNTAECVVNRYQLGEALSRLEAQ